jgi:hypothetical protein
MSMALCPTTGAYGMDRVMDGLKLSHLRPLLSNQQT